jgi:hypothetical protein
MFFAIRLEFSAIGDEKPTFAVRSYRPDQVSRERHSVGQHSFEVTTWTVGATPPPRVRVVRIGDGVRVSIVVREFDSPLAEPNTNSLDEHSAQLERRGADHVIVEIQADRTTSIVTDKLGNAQVFIGRALDGDWLIGSELWSLIDNGFPVHGNRPPPERAGATVTISSSGKLTRAHKTLDDCDSSAPVDGRRLRQYLARSVERICKRQTVGVLLSGGMDSSAVAAAARESIARDRLIFIHFRWPDGQRQFETDHALATAAHLGVELAIVPLPSDRLLPPHSICSDAAGHHWLHWQHIKQRSASKLCEIALTGAAGEWFGRDDPSSICRAFIANASDRPGVATLKAIGWRSFATALLRKPAPGLHPSALPYTARGGKMFLFANPFVAGAIPRVCPFTCAELYGLAAAAAGTGRRVEKTMLRQAFVGNLPNKVLSTPRRGTRQDEFLKHLGRWNTLEEVQRAAFFQHLANVAP